MPSRPQETVFTLEVTVSGRWDHLLSLPKVVHMLCRRAGYEPIEISREYYSELIADTICGRLNKQASSAALGISFCVVKETRDVQEV